MNDINRFRGQLGRGGRDRRSAEGITMGSGVSVSISKGGLTVFEKVGWGVQVHPDE